MKKIKNLGFTLLELMLASSIFIVVALTIYSSFHTGIFGYRNIEQLIDTQQTARLILERINLDIRNLFVYSADESKFSGQNKKLEFLTIVETYRENKIIPEYASVSFFLQENKLMRLCKTGSEALSGKSQVEPEEMAENADIALTYLYIDPLDNTLKEKDSWDDVTALPEAVRITLTLNKTQEVNFKRTIYLPF